jgi:predicted transcriptional regulator
MFRNMTSELSPQPERQPDPGAAARRRPANAGRPGRGDVSAEALAALEADLAGDPGAAAGDPGAAAEDRGAQESPDDHEEFNLTDPKAMRALAHPVRMSLLELLKVARTLTATQASELLGESPANCAFHLRTLAKYGFVREAGGGRGRERPWEGVSMTIHLSTQQEDPRASVTAGMLQRVWLDRVFERAQNVLNSTDALPDAWRKAHEASQSVEFLTPEETKELANEVLGILRRYEDRRDDPSRRPDSALPVEFLFFGYPLIDLAGLAGQAEQSGESADRTPEAPSPQSRAR